MRARVTEEPQSIKTEPHSLFAGYLPVTAYWLSVFHKDIVLLVTGRSRVAG
jgi:hypothetical protein